jgi:hypothetical protein
MSPARPLGSHMFPLLPLNGRHKSDASSCRRVSLFPPLPLQRHPVHHSTRMSTHQRHTADLQSRRSRLHLPHIASSDFSPSLFLPPHPMRLLLPFRPLPPCLGSSPSLRQPHCASRLICLLCPARALRPLTPVRLFLLRLERLSRLYSPPMHCHDSCLCRPRFSHLA